jgi:hypothetical protein
MGWSLAFLLTCGACSPDEPVKPAPSNQAPTNQAAAKPPAVAANAPPSPPALSLQGIDQAPRAAPRRRPPRRQAPR